MEGKANMAKAEDKSRSIHPELMLLYNLYFADIRDLAREHGWAAAAHGSLRSDLDLILVPWTEEAGDPNRLIQAIADMVQGKVVEIKRKHHGRVGVTILFRGKGYLDISVMPRVQPSLLDRENETKENQGNKETTA